MLIATLLLATTVSIPLDSARRVFDDVRLASEDDAGRIWGKPLYGPTIFVDPKTRFAVANQADSVGALHPEGGVFTGTLPPDVILANTATDWNGVHWTMVLWSSVADRSVARRRLLIHESFHRIQNDLGLGSVEGDNRHLDTLDGRYWFLLETRALAKALRNDDRKAAVADALAFRAKRRSVFPSAAAAERALENNEGLAEYTGVALRGTTDEESRQTFARKLDGIDRGTSFVRSFAYETGPAYGLLLDLSSPGWTRNYKSTDDLAATLAAAMKIVPVAAGDARAAAYDGVRLRTEEEQRDREQKQRVAKFRARLVDGPILELPMIGASYGFDPDGVVPIGDAGNAYARLNVSAAWGAIEATNGARMASDHSAIFVSAEDRSKLQLKEGWSIVAGSRPGDLRVVRTTP